MLFFILSVAVNRFIQIGLDNLCVYTKIWMFACARLFHYYTFTVMCVAAAAAATAVAAVIVVYYNFFSLLYGLTTLC